MQKQLQRLMGILAVLFISVSAMADTPITTENLFEMSLEQLMDIPVVYSGSRSFQKVSESSVPISIITAEDIHYSGLTTIPDILRFSVGMDVLPNNRNFSMVGVRGLHEKWSDRTLVLINGRSAESPNFGGPEFFRYPLMMEDIERIEVVRGPGGAAWGANAYNGVVNVITKKPEQIPGWFVSSTVNEFGDTFSHVRFARVSGDWSWRTSIGYNDAESSDNAGAGKITLRRDVAALIADPSAFKANDFSRQFSLDAEAFYTISESSVLSLGAAAAHNEFGNGEIGGYAPAKNGWFETFRSFAKLEHTFDDDSSGHLQWTGNFQNSTLPEIGKWKSYLTEIDGQYNFTAIENHATSIGGNLRFNRLRVDWDDDEPIQYRLRHKVYNESTWGIFLIDRWTLSDRWTIESQFRGDWYSETEKEISTRLSAIYTLDEKKEQTLRFSIARAFRNPMLSTRGVNKVGLPLGGGLYALNLIDNDNLKNENVWAFEAGYHQRLDARTTLSIDGYYNIMEDMIGYNYDIPEPAPQVGRTFFQAQNISNARAYGVETVLEHRLENQSLSAWYAYADVIREKKQADLRGYAPSRHKAGLTWRIFLDKDWTVNTNYRYQTSTESFNPFTDADPRHRLDLTVSRKIAKGKGELMVGVTDVLNKTEGPYASAGQVSAYEIPGRTFFARLQMQF